MTGLSVELPEELGTGRSSDSTGRRNLHIGRGSGGNYSEPVIVRWFDTWARGEDDTSLR